MDIGKRTSKCSLRRRMGREEADSISAPTAGPGRRKEERPQGVERGAEKAEEEGAIKEASLFFSMASTGVSVCVDGGSFAAQTCCGGLPFGVANNRRAEATRHVCEHRHCAITVVLLDSLVGPLLSPVTRRVGKQTASPGVRFVGFSRAAATPHFDRAIQIVMG